MPLNKQFSVHYMFADEKRLEVVLIQTTTSQLNVVIQTSENEMKSITAILLC